MTRLRVFAVIAVLLLAGTTVLVSIPSDATVPPPTTLQTIPARLGGWEASRDTAGDLLRLDHRPQDHLLRTYTNGVGTVWLSIGYYTDQKQGSRPVARALLFPGRGWTDITEQSLRIPVDPPSGPSIPVNLVVIRTEGESIAILYWYQLGVHGVASDHWYRLLLLYNRLIHRRGDGALVRIASPLREQTELAAVIAQLSQFAQVLYPELRRVLPR